MTLLWFVTGASLVVALVAWRQARRTAKRLEQLSQMYWELEVPARRAARAACSAWTGEPPPATRRRRPPDSRPRDSFVPLTSLKR